jgi:hypothetical protein
MNVFKDYIWYWPRDISYIRSSLYHTAIGLLYSTMLLQEIDTQVPYQRLAYPK